MIGILRFVGVVNAAVWFGAAIFVTLAVYPVFSSSEMQQLLGQARGGAAAQLVLDRYFLLQYWFGSIALAHLLAEWFYFGRATQKVTTGVVAVIYAIVLLCGIWLQPKLKTLHLVKYGVDSAPEQREEAARSFRIWQGVSMTATWIVLGGLFFYLWRVSTPPTETRFVPAMKFRG